MTDFLNPTVPVMLASSWGGLASNSGLLRFEGDQLVLEFESKDEVFQMLRSGIKRINLPLAELGGCEWKAGWWGGDIEISVRKLELLQGVAGASQGRVNLRVARKDRDRALGLASNVELALAQRTLTIVQQSDRA